MSLFENESPVYEWELRKIIELLERIAEAVEKKRKPRNINSEPCQLVDIWNKFTIDQLPKVNALSPGSTRHRNAIARWKEKPDDNYWTQVVLRINRTKFMLGDNERKWVADFDFFVKSDSHNKIMEGKYDNIHLSKGKTEKRIISYLEDGTPVYG